jgi:hypothetical protein
VFSGTANNNIRAISQMPADSEIIAATAADAEDRKLGAVVRGAGGTDRQGLELHRAGGAS